MGETEPETLKQKLDNYKRQIQATTDLGLPDLPHLLAARRKIVSTEQDKSYDLQLQNETKLFLSQKPKVILLMLLK